MICYMDRCWCRSETCRHYETCEKSQKYAMRKQAKECPDVRDRLPYAVRDLSDVCKEYEEDGEEWAERHGEASKNDGIDKAYTPIV